MNDSIQPFVNLINANLNVFSRLANSSEIKGVTRDISEKYVSVTQDAFERVAKSDALVEWTRAISENYARFAQEWMQSFFGMAQQTQDFITRQAEETTQQISTGVEATTRAAGQVIGQAKEEAKEEAEAATQLTKARQNRHSR